MEIVLLIIGFASGYAASIYTWPWIRDTWTSLRSPFAPSADPPAPPTLPTGP